MDTNDQGYKASTAPLAVMDTNGQDCKASAAGTASSVALEIGELSAAKDIFQADLAKLQGKLATLQENALGPLADPTTEAEISSVTQDMTKLQKEIQTLSEELAQKNGELRKPHTGGSNQTA